MKNLFNFIIIVFIILICELFLSSCGLVHKITTPNPEKVCAKF